MEPIQTQSQAQNKFLIPLSIVIAGMFVAAAIYFGGGTGSLTQRPVGTSPVEIDLPPVTAEDHIVGSPNADVIIVEYSDTECPFCKVFHNTMLEVVRTYGNKVAWVYRHFPIAQLHARAIKEAEATECAAELGGNQGFWNYTNRIFEVTNSNDSLDPSQLPIIASFVGLDVAAFNNCLSSGKHNAFILKSVEDAVKAGARGTPHSVIVLKQPLSNNDVDKIENIMLQRGLGPTTLAVSSDKKHISMSGALPLDLVKEIIDVALN